MINDLNLELRIAYLNVIRKEYLTRKKESRDPFSIYSTTIITGLPAKRAKEHTRIRAITEICAAVKYFQLWQLNYLYFINRNFISNMLLQKSPYYTLASPFFIESFLLSS